MAERERIAAATEESMRIAERRDLQYAVMVGQGAVCWAARALGASEQHDPDAVAALQAMHRLRTRLAAAARAAGGDGRITILTTRRGPHG
jgi:ribosomal 50S subunit-associated protein YjgA (DUF615 family)